MTEKQTELYSKIQAFDIDGGPVQFSFAQRLARENGWTREYTRRAIDEYRKFLFLSAAAGHPVTPSDEVDQVWHLHLMYSESYWNRLCKEVLPKPLLHGPTKGGKAEGDKFHDWYSKTLDSYQQFFGEPPADIWPAPADRFQSAQWQRVNASENWIIPKVKIRRGVLVGAIGAAGITLVGCEVTSQDYPLFVLFLLAGLAIIIGLIVSLFKRYNGGGGGGACGNTGGFIGSCGSSDSHHGHSGCGSHGDGGSGCGSSGCGSSGCGGGGCGGGCGGGD